MTKYSSRDYTGGEAWKFHSEKPVVGLDLGSRASKSVLIHGDTIHTALIPTGLFMQETADELLEKLLAGTGFTRADLGFIVSTGYGRISLSFDDVPFDVVTEISCHAMGAHALYPKTRTIIDIGGQDSKAIKVDTANGKVLEFVMNDKCAAGTGRFLEKAAALLGIDLLELGTAALQATTPAQISSQCVVFAESEMISLRAKGARANDVGSVPNIAAGIHYSAARRVRNLLGRVGVDPELLFTGGVSNNPGMRHVLEELIGHPFTPTNFDMIFAGALGAAVYAAQNFVKVRSTASVQVDGRGLDLSKLIEATERRQDEMINALDDVKNVGYFCVYTPVEIFNASGARHARLFKAGSAETVAAGELQTQSVFCDFSKTSLGGFIEGDGAIPLYRSIDKVYNFHTCGSIKRVSEAIDRIVPVKLLNLPKLLDNADSRDFFKGEIRHFRDDLAAFVGKEISEELIREQIKKYNKARRTLRKISELRKREHPPLKGSEFLELVRGFYYLPVDELQPHLDSVYQQLESQPDVGESRPRIMIAGSIEGDGDRRLVEILENELNVDIVVEDHCAGLKPFTHEIREDGDVFAALADGYLDQAPCARQKTLQANVEFSGKLATEYHVDGVLYVYLKFCSCYGASKREFLNHYNFLGIPGIEISSDYSESDHGQIKTRIEAFLEVINQKRSLKNEYTAV